MSEARPLTAATFFGMSASVGASASIVAGYHLPSLNLTSTSVPGAQSVTSRAPASVALSTKWSLYLSDPCTTWAGSVLLRVAASGARGASP